MHATTCDRPQADLDHLRQQLRHTEYERDVALQRVADVEALLAAPKSTVGKILERVNNIAQDVDDAADDLSYDCITRRQVINTLGTIARDLRAITEE